MPKEYRWLAVSFAIPFMLAITLLIFSISTAVLADDLSKHTSTSMQRLYELTDSALRAEIDLERYYLKYRLKGSAEPQWRRWRYFLGQSTGSGMFVASDSTNAAAFSRSLGHPVSNNVFRNSYSTGLVGSVIGATSDGVELCSNSLLTLKNIKYKCNPATAVAEVKASLAKIDKLLAERQDLLDTLPHNQARKISEIEGNVLHSYRNWCVYEFADIYAGIKAYQSSNNLYYAQDVAAYILYVASYKYAIDGIAHPSANGTSTISGIVGGVLFAENFAVTTVTAKLL